MSQKISTSSESIWSKSTTEVVTVHIEWSALHVSSATIRSTQRERRSSSPAQKPRRTRAAASVSSGIKSVSSGSSSSSSEGTASPRVPLTNAVVLAGRCRLAAIAASAAASSAASSSVTSIVSRSIPRVESVRVAVMPTVLKPSSIARASLLSSALAAALHAARSTRSLPRAPPPAHGAKLSTETSVPPSTSFISSVATSHSSAARSASDSDSICAPSAICSICDAHFCSVAIALALAARAAASSACFSSTGIRITIVRSWSETRSTPSAETVTNTFASRRIVRALESCGCVPYSSPAGSSRTYRRRHASASKMLSPTLPAASSSSRTCAPHLEGSFSNHPSRGASPPPPPPPSPPRRASERRRACSRSTWARSSATCACVRWRRSESVFSARRCDAASRRRRTDGETAEERVCAAASSWRRRSSSAAGTKGAQTGCSSERTMCCARTATRHGATHAMSSGEGARVMSASRASSEAHTPPMVAIRCCVAHAAG
mmetsp:Transcript_38276/g.95202  ORF Transcript_38276/g.95202 Transcript_38276/m.95202 type:complete len:493 (+) Transcript_38276:1891-3369(+)